MHTVKMDGSETVIQVCNLCYYKFRANISDEPFDRSLGYTCKICNCDPSDLTYGDHLFSLPEAAEEFKCARGSKETTVATAKYAGKFLVNTTVITAKGGFKVLKFAAGIATEIAGQAAKK